MDIQKEAKKFCYKELRQLKRWGGDASLALTRCYGAVMFALTIAPDDCEYEGLGWWWDNEMRPCFEELR